MEPLTPLQSKLVSMIVSHARLSGWEPGHHLTEESLLPVLATSRSPIRKAMAWLAAKGVLERRPNKGFFLRSLPPSDSKTLKSEIEPEGDKIYAAIAMDRLARRLPDVVSENELIRRYGVSRAQLRLALARMAAEGWIERRPGRGWEFQPLIDTVEAYRENYRFRQIVEPSAMRTPEFRIAPEKLAALRAQQLHVRDVGYKSLSQIELYEINSQFHQTLAGMSNNRFVGQTLQRLNDLRRLMEYGWPLDRKRVRRVCDEHLAILDALEAGDLVLAAARLEAHLGAALAEKGQSRGRDPARG
jgi:DNA-binding GntR family transcriptional regulator